MKTLIWSWLAIPVVVFAQSAYVGEENREIKSLSPAEIEGFLAGDGMGFAKAAELNGYPGPRHVLDMSEELELTAGQREATEAVFTTMRETAADLGAQLVEAERLLDTLFAERTIDADRLAAALSRIEQLRFSIRRTHLEAHLRQTEILTTEQVQLYMRLRGYHGANHHRSH